MSVAERPPSLETQDPILPGTIRHLDFLANLQIPTPQTLQELQGVLIENWVPQAFARIIRRHKTFSPLPSEGEVVLDSRMIDSLVTQDPVFRGTLSLNKSRPQINRLAINGRPNPNESVLYDYTYALSIPLTEDFSVDCSRPVEASFLRGSYKQFATVDRWIYRPQAFPEYDEHDPDVCVYAVKEAARELAALLRRQNGEVAVL